jgi:hypothetical protein
MEPFTAYAVCFLYSRWEAKGKGRVRSLVNILTATQSLRTIAKVKIRRQFYIVAEMISVRHGITLTVCELYIN